MAVSPKEAKRVAQEASSAEKPAHHEDRAAHRSLSSWGDEGGNPGPSTAPSPRRAPEGKLRVLTEEEQVERLLDEGGGQAHY